MMMMRVDVDKSTPSVIIIHGDNVNDDDVEKGDNLDADDEDGC